MTTLAQVVDELGLKPVVEDSIDREINSGYSSDLLSDVLKNAKPFDIWITNQKHQNCIAVASLIDLSAIIMAGGVEPDPDTIDKARAEHIPLYMTDLHAFDIVGRLYELGIRGPVNLKI